MNLLIIICGQVRTLNKNICTSINNLIDTFEIAGVSEIKILWSIDQHSSYVDNFQNRNLNVIYTDDDQFHKLAYALTYVEESTYSWIMKLRPDAIMEPINQYQLAHILQDCLTRDVIYKQGDITFIGSSKCIKKLETFHLKNKTYDRDTLELIPWEHSPHNPRHPGGISRWENAPEIQFYAHVTVHNVALQDFRFITGIVRSNNHLQIFK